MQAATDKAASNKKAKYRQLADSHMFIPFATWNQETMQLVSEDGPMYHSHYYRC